MPKKKKSAKINGSDLGYFIISSVLRLWEILKSNYRWLLIPLFIIALKLYAPSTFFILTSACLFFLIFYPAVTWLQSIVRSNRLAVSIFVIILTSFIIFTAAFIIPALISQIIEFTKNYPQIQNAITNKINQAQVHFQVFQKSLMQITNISTNDVISKYLHQWGQAMINFFDGIVQSLSQILTRVFHVLVAFIVSLYMLFERKTLFNFFKNYLAKVTTNKDKEFATQAYQQIIAYFSGLMLLALVGFLATWIFLSVIGLKFSLLLAIWTGIMEFIPIFGPIIAIIPIAIVAWTQSASLVLYIIIFFLVLQFILGYLLAPQVLGKKSQFSPIVVFIILLIGGETYGIPGMIFSIPLVALFILFWKIYFLRNID